MLDTVASIVIDSGLQAVGWGVLKIVTFGRYQGFKPEDVLVEATLGVITLAALGYGIYRWVF